jgi:hypothetical protein
MKVAIRRFHLGSLGKMGCLLGTVAAFLPSFLCGLLVLALANLLLKWLAGWEELTISFLGQEMANFDLVQFLGLEKALEQLQILTSISGPVLVLIVLALALVSGAFLALIVVLVGLAYNLLSAATGGLVVEMSAVAPREAPVSASPTDIVPEDVDSPGTSGR